MQHRTISSLLALALAGSHRARDRGRLRLEHRRDGRPHGQVHARQLRLLPVPEPRRGHQAVQRRRALVRQVRAVRDAPPIRCSPMTRTTRRPTWTAATRTRGRTTAMCGDKIVQDGEDCDDGNKVEDDGCDSTCHLSGSNPITTRSCPGLDTHVWSKPVTYVGTTIGSTFRGNLSPNCKSDGVNPTSGLERARPRVQRHRAQDGHHDRHDDGHGLRLPPLRDGELRECSDADHVPDVRAQHDRRRRRDDDVPRHGGQVVQRDRRRRGHHQVRRRRSASRSRFSSGVFSASYSLGECALNMRTRSPASRWSARRRGAFATRAALSTATARWKKRRPAGHEGGSSTLRGRSTRRRSGGATPPGDARSARERRPRSARAYGRAAG